MDVFEESMEMLNAYYMEKGVEKGRKGGREEVRKEVILALLKDKFSLDRIVRLTDTTVEYVKSLRAAL